VLLDKWQDGGDERAGRGIHPVAGREMAVRVNVQLQGQAELPQVVLAPGPAGRLSGRLNGGQEQRDQQAHDHDYDQQLNDRKGGMPVAQQGYSHRTPPVTAGQAAKGHDSALSAGDQIFRQAVVSLLNVGFPACGPPPALQWQAPIACAWFPPRPQYLSRSSGFGH
jgi:hypothetical protein